MAIFQNHNDCLQVQAHTETLPTGFASYLRSLAAMAELVKAACLNYRLKLFVNRLLLSIGIKGHDFPSEVASLFFSFVIRFGTRATRLTLSLFKTPCAHSKRNPVTVTTRLRFCVRCWLSRVLCHVLSSAACGLMWLTMYGARFTAIGMIHGFRLIRPTKRQHPAGIKNSLINCITKSGNKTRTIAYA